MEISHIEDGFYHNWYLDGRSIRHAIGHEKEFTQYEKYDEESEMSIYFSYKYILDEEERNKIFLNMISYL